MLKFSKDQRDGKMTDLVSFHGVPMPRANAFVINHIEEHGAKVAIYSCDRTVAAIAAHNKQFGTNLHAQQYLYDHQNEPGFNPANSPSTTSHCYFADGNPHYASSAGRVYASGARIPWFMVGTDLDDYGKNEYVVHFLATAHGLGYPYVQPYASGSERHHVVLTKSPISVLEHWNVIAKERHT